MSYNKTETINVRCDKLKNTARLALTYLLVEVDQELDPVKKQLTNFDCLDKEKCGVAKENKDGSVDFYWETCPFYKKYTN